MAWQHHNDSGNLPIHVYPVNDEKEHDVEDSEGLGCCSCNPVIDWSGPRVLVIHNAFDMRELIEQAEEIKND